MAYNLFFLEQTSMREEIIEKLAQLTTAAFGLIAALAWNDAVKTLFQEGGPLASLASYGPWIYAVIVTVIAVFAAIWIGRAAQRVKDEDENTDEQ